MQNFNSKLKTFLSLLVAGALLFPVGLTAASETDTVRLIVELKEPTSQLLEPMQEIRRISDRAPRSYVAADSVRRSKDLRRWRVIEVGVSQREEVVNQLKQNPAVVSVQAEQLYQAAFIPNDPRYGEQIGLDTAAWPLDINAPEAWERTTGSSNTVIAVVDGGVDLAHEDLKDKIWTNPGEIAGNHQDDDGNGFIDDVHGWDFIGNAPAGAAIDHATHVAGIAAASSNNGVGVAGVDWGARIMSVRVLGGNGFGGEAGIAEGIDYAVASGANVINLSIAGPGSGLLRDAVENAYASGVVVVAAAGNSGTSTDGLQVMPVCADVNGVNLVIGVGALDDEGEPASFSNYGKCVDVSAPGKDILSTKTDNRYGTMKGTSMASPFVAGVAGLYLSLHPNASPAEVVSAITNNMTTFVGDHADDWTADYKGRLNAAAVVGANTTSPQPSPNLGEGQSNPAQSLESSSGGGSGDSGGGGGGGGGSGSSESSEPSETSKTSTSGKVAGATQKISSADRKAFDFIQNKDVPAVVARLFQKVWGRPITPAESTYWKLRARSDKATQTKLLGAMEWWKAKGKSFVKTASTQSK